MHLQQSNGATRALDAAVASSVPRGRIDNTAQLRLANKSMMPLIFDEILMRAIKIDVVSTATVSGDAAETFAKGATMSEDAEVFAGGATVETSLDEGLVPMMETIAAFSCAC